MKNIVNFGIAFMYVTFFECFQTMPLGNCVGISGASCCFGFKWDTTQKKCIRCGKGYTGPNCEMKCPHPSYGEDCQMICNCIKKDCDPANGCNITSKGYPVTSLLGLEDKIVTTELLNNETSISDTCKEGYYGTNCELKCHFPFFGLSCHKKCNCIKKDCDHVKGCLLSPKEHFSPPSVKDIQHNTATKKVLKSEDSYFENSSEVTTDNDKTTCMAVKQESKRTNYLKFALIGLTIVFIIIICIYFNMRLLEKRFMITRIV